MPAIYAAADLFVSASLYETFGLVYLEAQLARLPAVAHDTPITRHLFVQLPDKLKATSLVDMRRPGAAAAAISRWAAMLANPSERECTRATLETFAQAQEQQFSWSSTAPKLAAAFTQLLETTRAKLGAAPPLDENEIAAFLQMQDVANCSHKKKDHAILSEAKYPSFICHEDPVSADAANAPHKSAKRISLLLRFAETNSRRNYRSAPSRYRRPRQRACPGP